MEHIDNLELKEKALKLFIGYDATDERLPKNIPLIIVPGNNMAKVTIDVLERLISRLENTPTVVLSGGAGPLTKIGDTEPKSEAERMLAEARERGIEARFIVEPMSKNFAENFRFSADVVADNLMILGPTNPIAIIAPSWACLRAKLTAERNGFEGFPLYMIEQPMFKAGKITAETWYLADKYLTSEIEKIKKYFDIEL